MGAIQKPKRKTARPLKVRRPILIHGEGLDETSFIKHLRNTYQNENIYVKISKGNGGDPTSVVRGAIKTTGSYYKRAVILDNDKPASEMTKARKLAKEKCIVLIENTPCLEGLLLAILNPTKTYENEQSSWCKREFEKNYIDKANRDDPAAYIKIFPQTLLEKRRMQISNLNRLISLISQE